MRSWRRILVIGGSQRRPASYRVRDREAVDLEQFLNATLRVEPLLVGLARLVTVNLVPLGVAVDIGDGERQRRWIAGGEQYAVDFRGDEFGERPVACRDRRDASGHGLDGNKAERFLPGRWQQDRSRLRNEFGAPVAADRAVHYH